MWLIVGLGNPGAQYEWTPHNLGFLAVDAIAERAGIRVERPEAKSLVGFGKIAGQDVALAKPQTMMNLSGFAVRDLLARAQPDGATLLVFVRIDVALPWGMLRIRERGTAGGHNGVKSVIGAIGTVEFPRVRLGAPSGIIPIGDLAEYVLRPMRKAELESAAEMNDQAVEAIELIFDPGHGQDDEQSSNRRVPPGEDRELKERGFEQGARRAETREYGRAFVRLWIFICMPATPEEEIAKIIGMVEHAASEHGGKIEKTEKWGTRKMAYRVSKQREGFYVYISLRSTQGELIKELERRLKVNDAVIKYQTVRLDEEIKRQQKLIGRRERRSRRRPRKPAPGASAPAAPPTPAPATPAERPAAAPAAAAPAVGSRARRRKRNIPEEENYERATSVSTTVIPSTLRRTAARRRPFGASRRRTGRTAPR